MKIIAANNAFSTLATLGAPAATTLRLAPGGGELFEEPILGKEYFVGTLSDRTGALNEIVWVTERIGDVLTVMRAQENTLAQSWPVGTRFQNLITAGSLLASIGSIHDPVEITPINDSYTLIAAESGNTYSNDGAIHVVEVTLPIDAPNGTQYTFLSVESNVGIRIKRPGVGVFLSYDEKMGVDIASYTKGSSCKLVKTN
jgi:hypothetical protein